MGRLGGPQRFSKFRTKTLKSALFQGSRNNMHFSQVPTFEKFSTFWTQPWISFISCRSIRVKVRVYKNNFWANSRYRSGENAGQVCADSFVAWECTFRIYLRKIGWTYRVRFSSLKRDLWAVPCGKKSPGSAQKWIFGEFLKMVEIVSNCRT